MKVSIYTTQKRFPIDASAAVALTKEVLSCEGCQCDEVALHFVGTQRICRLHEEYFNDPSLTDCISFPIDSDASSGYQVLGEVFVCPETARRYVGVHGGDLYEEITLYIVHGLMHLLGYDDLTEKDRTIMRQKEHFYMQLLKSKNMVLSRKDIPCC